MKPQPSTKVDARAFERIMREHNRMLFRTARAILQIPPATVRTRFFRARSLLREALAQKIDLACEDAFSFAGARCDRIVARVLARIKDL